MHVPLASDFTFWQNRITREQAESIAHRYSMYPSVHRVFIVAEVGRMSIHHIPLPLAHFEVALWLPMDPAFADFLVLTRVQPKHVHPNAVCIIFCLIVLCHRLSFELTPNILRMFFSSVQMLDNTLSLRPRRNKVLLFYSPPNKIDLKGSG